MNFLCANHLNQLKELPQSSIADIWLSWIQQAGSLYAMQRWDLGIPFLGCAFDLSREMFTHKNYDNDNTAIQLTLSSIYLGNTFQHYGDKERSDVILNTALKTLHQHWLKDRSSQKIHECLEVILNEKQHSDFFLKHLNLAFSHPSAHLLKVVH